jgi:hypothetical protein
MAGEYDDSMKTFPRLGIWEFADSFPVSPYLRKEKLGDATDDAHHVIRAILAGADAIRCTIIEESQNIQKAIRESRH